MSETNKKIITRFAPSPTGLLHAGSYRTALFNYIYAKQNGGSFVLRIEDTDKERSKKEYEDNILDSLKWLNINYDVIWRQTERVDIHKKYLKQLVESGHAYISKEEPKEPGARTEVIRFKNPNTKVSFDDLIRGKIEFDTTDLGDFVIAKSYDEPLFHLAVVVDDFEMGITHIIRGEDHISNTPRQILIQRAINAPTPLYAHLPIVLAADRSKLSKRKGALPVSEYRDRGYLPEALFNYMVLIGWNPGTDQEIMSEEEIIKLFDISKIQKGGAIFNDEKLKWLNKEYLNKLSDSEFKENLLKFIPEKYKSLNSFNEIMDRTLQTLREKISYFKEVDEMELNGDLSYFFDKPGITAENILCSEKQRKGKDIDLIGVVNILSKVAELLNNPELDFSSPEKIKEIIWPYAEEQGRGIVLWAIRYSLSGKERSPDPFTLSYILGKTESLSRLEVAINLIKNNA